MTFDDGTTSIGVGTLSGSGVATFSTSTLNVAGSPHTISAVYGGDSNFTTSTSNSLTQTVTKATTTHQPDRLDRRRRRPSGPASPSRPR